MQAAAGVKAAFAAGRNGRKECFSLWRAGDRVKGDSWSRNSQKKKRKHWLEEQGGEGKGRWKMEEAEGIRV